jgi:hypothetical protein
MSELQIHRGADLKMHAIADLRVWLNANINMNAPEAPSEEYVIFQSVAAYLAWVDHFGENVFEEALVGQKFKRAGK